MVLSDVFKTQYLISIIHYLAPLIVLGYFLVASIINFIDTGHKGKLITRHARILTLTLSAVLIVSYSIEAAVIVYQIFHRAGPLSAEDYNVYALSEILVWTIFWGTLHGASQQRWYPYLGSWAIGVGLEIGIILLVMSSVHTSGVLGWVQLSLHFFRVLTMLFLIGLAIFEPNSSKDNGTDEESVPLLEDSDVVAGTTQVHASGFGTLNNDEAAISADAEIEMAKKNKEEKEKVAKLNARIAEEGGWYKYICSYSLFIQYIWPFDRPLLILNMIGTALCVLSARALNILSPRQIGIVVTYLEHGQPKAFGALAIYILLAWLNSFSGVKALQEVLWVPVKSYARTSLSTASYNHIMDLSCDFHDEKQSGELYTAMSQGRSLVKLLDTLLVDLFPIFIDLALALGYFYILFDTYLVLIGAATMVFYLWSFMRLMDISMKVHRKQTVAARKQYSVLFGTMGEWRTVSYFNRIPHAKQIYSSSVLLSQRFENQLRYLYQFGFGANEMTLQIGGLAALFFAAYQVIYEGKPVGSFVTLMTFWWTFTDPIHHLAIIHRDVLEEFVQAEELLTLFRRNPSVENGASVLEMKGGKIVFDDVYFHYNAKPTLIEGLSFVAEPGKTIALIGETGAGKSTILKLLFRFYDVSDGSISIDGQDIRSVSIQSLRENIGVVPQDASLFNDTVLANVKYARLDATEAEVHEACKAAAIHDRIMTFPEGYNTKVGEKGQKVSGGELQRLAIARAMLKAPKIILLDEATSSVDNETESKIQAGLNRLCKGRTTFIVAHRLSTIMEADMILVINDGKVVEQGTPKTLLARKGDYYKLWSKQMGIMDVLAKVEQSDTLVDTSTPTSSCNETLPDLCHEKKGDTQQSGTSPKGHKHNSGKRFRPNAPEFVPNSIHSSSSKKDQKVSTRPTQGHEEKGENGQETAEVCTISQSAEKTNAANSKHHRSPLRRRKSTRSDPGNYDSEDSPPPDMAPLSHLEHPATLNEGHSNLGQPYAGNIRRKRQKQWRSVELTIERETSSSDTDPTHMTEADDAPTKSEPNSIDAMKETLDR